MRQIVSVLFVALLFSLVSAQFNQAVWDTVTSDNLEDILSPQAIAVNGYEQFHLVYEKALLNGSAQICYRFYDMLAGFSPEIVTYTGYEIYNPAIASIMGDEIAEVAIVFEAGGDLVLCCNSIPPGPWDYQNFTNSADDDLSPSICYANYDPMIAWVRHSAGEYKIKFARWDGDSIHIETLEDSQLGDFGSGAKPFIVEYQSLPHIFYRGVNDNAYNIHHAYKTHQDSSWIIEYLETPNADDYSVSAIANDLGDIYVAISGNDGWGMPSHVYYMARAHSSGVWTAPDLVTGAYSASNASILYRPGHQFYIASCGISGNIYNGNVYLSNNLSGSFETQLLATYPSVTQPVLSDVIGEYGVLVFDAPIGGESSQDIEIVYYGPQLNGIIDNEQPPISFGLPNVYPNPFNSRTKIAFTIDRPGRVTLDVFDIAGRKVESLMDKDLPVGKYEMTWNADSFASGMYFYRLSNAGNSVTRKMLLLK
jgi:hypothetical protein